MKILLQTLLIVTFSTVNVAIFSSDLVDTKAANSNYQIDKDSYVSKSHPNTKSLNSECPNPNNP